MLTYPANLKVNSAVVAGYGLCYACWVGLFLALFSIPALGKLSLVFFVVTGFIFRMV
jgi:hypothetical protein